MRWDVFCHVVDNYGDVGVAWRLTSQLAARGESVRLWLDDASALAWMAPAGAPRVAVHPWDAAAQVEPAEVVLESFACGLPRDYAARLTASSSPPVWMNLEYLSAEDYVERSHGLPSPRPSAAAPGLTLWFYYPGFTPRTGGLLREPDLMARRERFDRLAWLGSLRPDGSLAPRPAERIVVLFCYDNPALPALLGSLATEPTLLLATAGPAARQVEAILGPALSSGALRAGLLPLLTQTDFDHLLWSADWNFVRGEDSLVRAIWAGVPFVWQAYAQHDAAHLAKLDALLRRFLQGAEPALAHDVRSLFAAWNGAAPWPRRLPERRHWQTQVAAWRAQLLEQQDLCSALLRFAAERR